MPLFVGIDWASQAHAVCVIDETARVRWQDSLLVDTLVDAGFQIVPIHPNVLNATRSRYSEAGGKSDPGDAFILADLLRTDGHRLRPLRPPSDDTRALRALVRGRDDLIAQRLALAN